MLPAPPAILHAQDRTGEPTLDDVIGAEAHRAMEESAIGTQVAVEKRRIPNGPRDATDGINRDAHLDLSRLRPVNGDLCCAQPSADHCGVGTLCRLRSCGQVKRTCSDCNAVCGHGGITSRRRFHDASGAFPREEAIARQSAVVSAAGPRGSVATRGSHNQRMTSIPSRRSQGPGFNGQDHSTKGVPFPST